MQIVHAIILGIVQGVTEWLPVSSSGHLAIVQNIFGLSPPVIYHIFLHIGTLIAVTVFLWKEIIAVLRSVLKLEFKSENGKFGLFIILALFPTALIGFTFKRTFESFFYNLTAVGIALIATGFFLFICEKWEKKKKLGAKEAILVGIAQGISIIPGVSRSGSTIGTGLIAGVSKERAAKFSFMLSIPAIIGATVFEFNALTVSSIGWHVIIIGTAISAISGYASIRVLMELIKRQKFHWFAVYCWFIGALVLTYTNLF